MEAWLSGPVAGVPPELMPAAHMLLQASSELRQAAAQLPPDRLWQAPGAASIGFHLRHIAGSADRLLTYAAGSPLSEPQRAELAAEKEPGAESVAQLLERVDAIIERVLAVYRSAARETLFEARAVGRAQLPSSVFGLLYHIAEHTVRHTGQVIATAKIVGNQ